MFITKVIIHNYLRERQKLNKCSSMNPLLLPLLLPNKQAQTQISWFYYLFNDYKRSQSKYREMLILFHVRPFCNCLIVLTLLSGISFFSFFFFFKYKKNSPLARKIFKPSLHYRTRRSIVSFEFESLHFRDIGPVNIKTSRVRFYLNSIVLRSKFGTRGHRRSNS